MTGKLKLHLLIKLILSPPFEHVGITFGGLNDFEPIIHQATKDNGKK
jgi:hypothetical protein